MTKLLESSVLRDYLNEYFDGKIDSTIPEYQLFLNDYVKSLLMLLPELSEFLNNMGLEIDNSDPLKVMAAVGATLKYIAEDKIKNGSRLDDLVKKQNNEKKSPIILH